jgi:hypothetical protein
MGSATVFGTMTSSKFHDPAFVELGRWANGGGEPKRILLHISVSKIEQRMTRRPTTGFARLGDRMEEPDVLIARGEAVDVTEVSAMAVADDNCL